MLIRFLMLSLFNLSTLLLLSQQSFKQSVQALTDGDTEIAIKALDSIISSGQVSAEVYSNLAHAHFLEGSNAKAILNYERALILNPGNEAIEGALNAIRERLEVNITDIPDFILTTMYREVVNIMSSTSWSILQLILGMIGIGALFLLLFPRGLLPPRQVKIIGITALVLCLLMGVFAWSKKGYEQDKDHGIIMFSNKAIYAAPDDQSPEVAPVGSGNKVLILSELGDWFKVELRDRDTGWIKKSALELI